jgi:hypothetical protein
MKVSKTTPKVIPTSQLVDLNHPATVQVSDFKGTNYLAIRYMYEDDNGQLQFGKNGVNIPIEYAVMALKKLVEVYNEATGSALELVGETTVPDPELE